MQPLWGGCAGFDALKSVQQGIEDNLPLQAGQARTQAKMSALAESQVAIVLAVEAVFVRVFESLGIAVAGTEGNHDPAAARNHNAADLNVSRGLSPEVLNRRVEAQGFFEGDRDKIAKRTKDYEERFANPFVAAERGYIDEVILPHSTRRRVARALALLRSKNLQNPWKKHDNIPL